MNFKNLFKKEKPSQIVNYDAFITNISRDMLENDPQKLRQLEEYKKYCLQKLNDKKHLWNQDFDNDSLLEDIKMNSDLILYLLFKETPDNKLENIIKIIKLQLYLNHLNELESDLTIKLIAIKEIRHEKPFLSPIKRRTLCNLSDTLAITRNVLIVNKDAVIREIYNRFSEIKTSIRLDIIEHKEKNMT